MSTRSSTPRRCSPPVSEGLDRLNTRPFVELIKSYDPAWAVCTHFLPAEIVSSLKARRRLRARLAAVVTDFDVHAMWLHRHVDRYFVASRRRANIRCNNLPVIARKIDRLLDDPARLSTMQEQARRLGRPVAAGEIADALLDWSG